jgi:hypothetical protein
MIKNDVHFYFLSLETDNYSIPHHKKQHTERRKKNARKTTRGIDNEKKIGKIESNKEDMTG